MKHYSSSLGGRTYNISAAVQERGEELVLFLHGLGCGKSAFIPAFADPRFDKFTLFAPDGIGFGDSDKSLDFSYSVEDQAAVLASALDKISFHSLHIVAHSYGNAVALLLPTIILDRVKTFINAEGNLIAEDCGIVSRKISSYEFPDFEVNCFPEMVQQEPSGPGYFEFDKMLPYAFWRGARSLVNWSDSGDLLQKFNALDCYKEYFYGDQSRDMAILSQLGKVPQIEIKNSGHFMSADNPKQFFSEVYRVISSIESVSTTE